jgi:hypothetical protein
MTLEEYRLELARATDEVAASGEVEARYPGVDPSCTPFRRAAERIAARRLERMGIIPGINARPPAISPEESAMRRPAHPTDLLREAETSRHPPERLLASKPIQGTSNQ